MGVSKFLKLLIFNILIALFSIIVFSPGLLGLDIGSSNTFEAALGITLIFMGSVIFIFGNYRILMTTHRTIKTIEIKTSDDCISALEQNIWKKTFSKDIKDILEQIERMKKKKETIIELLQEKFNTTEISYNKFESTITEVDVLFYINVKSIINRLNIFDETEYQKLSKHSSQQELSKSYSKEKMNIYNEYISFIKNSVEDNEEILLKIDKLLLELSKLNSLEEGELENMITMKEIDELINKTKYYKQ